MRLALFAPDVPGHLNPMTTLGWALRQRGHHVSLVGLPESRPKAEAAGLEFLPIGEAEHAAGFLAAGKEKLGRLQGFAAMHYTGQMLREFAAITLRDGPEWVRRMQIEGIVTDQVSPGGSVAEVLDVPCAVACNALALHQEPAVPPPVVSWPPRRGRAGRLRNHIGHVLLNIAARPVRDEINAFRVRHQLSPITMADMEHDGLVQVAQQPEFFDFPRERLPDHFHFTGPWHRPDRDARVAFPWERLDGRPLVYASLGTLQNRLLKLFAAIASACSELDVQLVLTLGRPDADTALGFSFPRGAVIVPYAPQLEVLRRAAAVITHAGLNTTLETLACGVPMIAIPLTNDQPGVARRAAHLGAAEIVLPRHATAARLHAALRRILDDPAYRAAAERCQAQLRDSPTVHHAAALIVYALQMRTRLTRRDALEQSLRPASLN